MALAFQAGRFLCATCRSRPGKKCGAPFVSLQRSSCSVQSFRCPDRTGANCGDRPSPRRDAGRNSPFCRRSRKRRWVSRRGLPQRPQESSRDQRSGNSARNRIWNANEIRFENLRATAVGAAIEPFGDTMPGKELRDRFLSFALKLLGDPRVNALRWQGCLKARDIACRWLTEQSLRQFFEVVGHVARPEHWNYRHAFWNALYEKNYIYDAWVVFDRYGAAEARRMFQGKISFATFNETVQQGHAVLLLRIGSLIIAEWSHTGSCRIWDTSKGESGPQLYKNRYRKAELQAQVNPEGVFGHYNPTGYFWQRKIADYLRSRCNIVLYQTDYQVR